MNWKLPLFRVHAPPWHELGPALKDIFYLPNGVSGYWAEGTAVAEFERRLRDYFGTPNLFATNSGTTALAIALKLAGVGPASIVLAPPMTCIATVAPAVTLGADIQWLDVDPRTGMVAPESIPHLYRPPDALMAVDWGGDVAPIASIRKVLDDAYGGIPLIEDAAQAMGTKTEGADYRCFSFQAIKHLTTADGGCCITRTPEDAERGKSLSWYGIDRKNFRLPTGEIDWDADVPEVGLKGNMNNVTAAIGNCQMKYLAGILEKHAANGALYTELLADVGEVDVPPRKYGSAFWVFTALFERRDELMAYLQAKGIQASQMHTRLDSYSGIPTVGDSHLPGVDEFSSRHLCLPCGWWVKKPDILGVVAAIKQFYSGRAQ